MHENLGSIFKESINKKNYNKFELIYLEIFNTVSFLIWEERRSLWIVISLITFICFLNMFNYVNGYNNARYG